jgi:hypothetical protein
LATLIHYIPEIILKSEQNPDQVAPLSSTPPILNENENEKGKKYKHRNCTKKS